MRRRTDRREHVLHEREVQHLLGGDDCATSLRQRVTASSSSAVSLSSVLCFSENAAKQVLAHDPVLQLGGLAQHVDAAPRDASMTNGASG